MPHALRPPAPAVAEIDLSALSHNLEVVRRRSGGLRAIAVVKANAYGHGVERVARHLAAQGVATFAVATLPEAFTLREAGITQDIIVFAAPIPDQIGHYVRHGLALTITSPETADAAVRVAVPDAPLAVHVKVDTGMGRIGLSPEAAPDVIRRLERCPGIRLAGLWTHLATADEPDHPLVARQAQRFRALLRTLGGAPAPLHLANSGAVFMNPEATAHASFEAMRVGISLYGILDPAAAVLPDTLQPVMRLTAAVTQVKEVPAGTPISYGATWTSPRPTRIATVAAGYADGYRRALSNRAWVGLHGMRCPVAGRVCMDMFMIDAGPEGEGPAVAPGDRAVLFGQDGPSVADLAGWADTITYEITCGITARVERVVSGGA